MTGRAFLAGCRYAVALLGIGLAAEFAWQVLGSRRVAFPGYTHLNPDLSNGLVLRAALLASVVDFALATWFVARGLARRRWLPVCALPLAFLAGQVVMAGLLYASNVWLFPVAIVSFKGPLPIAPQGIAMSLGVLAGIGWSLCGRPDHDEAGPKEVSKPPGKYSLGVEYRSPLPKAWVDEQLQALPALWTEDGILTSNRIEIEVTRR